MIQQLIQLLPTHIGTAGLVVALLGAAVGVGLWLTGARVSRSLLAILAAAGGGAAGFQAPAWMGWVIDPMATAVVGALVTGVAGFLTDWLLAAVGLGIVLAAWAAVVTLGACGTLDCPWPELGPAGSAAEYLKSIYHELPVNVSRLLPYTCGLAFVAGGVAAVLWRRVGVVLLWSIAGLSLALSLGIAAARAARPECLRVIPAKGVTQAIVLCGLVAFGAVFQWNLTPTAAPIAKLPKPQPKAKAPKDDMDD